MQLHISNTEHVQCACNDYKLQELTFKCLNLYFVRVIRTLKGGIVGLQIVFKMFNLDSYYPLPDSMYIQRTPGPDVDSLGWLD